MPGRKYEAKERTVKKMSRDGLLEESLSSGKQTRVSNRMREDISIREGALDTDAGLLRHSAKPPDDRGGIYGKGQEIPEQEPAASSGNRRKQRCKSQRIQKEIPGMTAEGVSEGGDLDAGQFPEGNDRKSQQRKRAVQYREQMERAVPARKKLSQKEIPAEDTGSEGTEEIEKSENLISEHSSRMDSVRGRSAALAETSVTAAEDGRHDRNKKEVQRYYLTEKRKKRRLEEAVPETESLSDRREEIQKKQKKERLTQEQRKKKTPGEDGKKKSGRLLFDDEDPGGTMARGSGVGFGGKAVSGAMAVAAGAVHTKIHEAEDENAGAEAAHSGEMLAEQSVRKASVRRLRQKTARNSADRWLADRAGLYRLNFNGEPAKTANAARQEAEKKVTIRKFFQKQRYRRMYAAAKREEKAVNQVFRASRSLTEKAAVVVREVFRRNSKIFLGLGVLGVLCLLIAASVTSCTSLMQGVGSSVVSTTYAATDDEIYRVEEAYEDMERALNDQINGIENRYPEYDTFRYQIDEISHNPYHLISYFTAKYGEFTYNQVKDELEEIFREQYGISTSGEQNVAITETRRVRVGESLGQVVTSGYCNCSICCGQWAGGPTASGVYPTAGRTIAVDASHPFVPLGTHVVMNGVEYVVEDTGSFARYVVQFDVYYGDHASAQAHGHQTWEAYLADSNGDREVEVTTTESVNRLSVTLTNHNLDPVLRNRMTSNEEKRYEIYNETYGNRNYLFDLDTIPSYSIDGGYSIPPEALSDEKFARMYAEATRYLGVPYVWGGYSPSGFDCSGFVSWVINHCGNGWNYGRLTAEGIRQVCAYVRPSDAKPGDIIFFERTYDTPGASHVGIYLGDGKMIHCGKPVQIASMESQYWKDHFMQFGRLP